MAENSGREWLNLSETANILGVHPSTVRLWANKGDLPSQRTSGGHRRFRRGDIEAWSASRRRGPDSGATLVVQSALGRARLEISEGRMARWPWYSKLSESARAAHREAGQRLLAMLKKYLTDDDREASLVEARRLGADYCRLGRVSHLSLAECVRAFLYFRDFLAESAAQIVEAAGPAQTQPLSKLNQLTSQFTNEILIALISAHETELKDGQHDPDSTFKG